MAAASLIVRPLSSLEEYAWQFHLANQAFDSPGIHPTHLRLLSRFLGHPIRPQQPSWRSTRCPYCALPAR